MSNFEENINAKFLRNTATLVQDIKNMTYKLIDFDNVQLILDIGCGPGVDTVEMAKRSPDNVKIIGVDNDKVMIKAAEDYAKKENVSNKINHIQSSVDSLPFEDNHFDIVRAERLFQVISKTTITPEKILKELTRVLKPEGKLILADTDWATASINFSDIDLERKLIRFFSDHCRPNGYTGREFYTQLKSENFKDVIFTPIPITMFDFNDENPFGNWLVKEAKDKKAATDDELELWMKELKQKSNEGKFLAVVNMNVVTGIKND